MIETGGFATRAERPAWKDTVGAGGWQGSARDDRQPGVMAGAAGDTRGYRRVTRQQRRDMGGSEGGGDKRGYWSWRASILSFHANNASTFPCVATTKSGLAGCLGTGLSRIGHGRMGTQKCALVLSSTLFTPYSSTATDAIIMVCLPGGIG